MRIICLSVYKEVPSSKTDEESQRLVATDPEKEEMTRTRLGFEGSLRCYVV